MSSLDSLEIPESRHQFFTAISVATRQVILQFTQKNNKGWKKGLLAEMTLTIVEAYLLPTNAKFVVGSFIAGFCERNNPELTVVLEMMSQQILIDKIF